MPEEKIAAEPKAAEPGAPGGARGAIANASWNAFATAFSIAISFAVAPALIHNVGTAEYGILLILWSFSGVMGIIGCGFGEATLRYVARYHSAGDVAGVNRVFGATLSFYVCACALLLVVILPAAPGVIKLTQVPADQQDLVAWLLRVSALTFSMGMISSAFLAIPMALQRYDISSKVGIVQNLARSGGYIVLALCGFGIVQLVVWDLAIGFAVLIAQVVVARRLLPEANLKPSFTFNGFREILGYSGFSFLTYMFHTMYRESGKLILGGSTSTSAVAYVGTPESVAYRLYMVIISGNEALMPRFSANRDAAVAKELIRNGTWTVIAASVTVLIPLAVLMPDVLRLWISPEFAAESALAGKIMAVSFLAPALFAPIATYFRGTGSPAVVTVVMALAGVTVFLFCLFLAPRLGPVGVAMGYLLSSIAWIGGLLWGWNRVFGSSSAGSLFRAAGVPLVIGAAVFLAETQIRNHLAQLNWIGLIALGTSFVGVTALMVFMADIACGGNSPARHFLKRISASTKITSLLSFLPARRTS